MIKLTMKKAEKLSQGEICNLFLDGNAVSRISCSWRKMANWKCCYEVNNCDNNTKHMFLQKKNIIEEICVDGRVEWAVSKVLQVTNTYYQRYVTFTIPRI